MRRRHGDAERDDPYAAISLLYDREHAGFADDLDLYRNAAVAVGDPILELGCGSGRVLLALARLGFRVTGLDRSERMLAAAAAAVQGAGLSDRVSLVRGDMATADAVAGGPFGLVLIPLNGLLHVSSAAGQRAVLAAARRALDPRGQMILDLLNPTPGVLQHFDGRVEHEGRWWLDDGSRCDKFSSRRAAPSEQTIATHLWYDLTAPDESPRRIATEFAMRYLHRAELELLLELAGFAAWAVYGGYDLEPFDDAGERLIVMAEASPGPVAS